MREHRHSRNNKWLLQLYWDSERDQEPKTEDKARGNCPIKLISLIFIFTSIFMHIIFHISCVGTWCRIWWYFSIYLLQIIRLLPSGPRGGRGCRQPWSSFCYSADCPPPCPRCTCWGQSSCGHLSWLCRSPAWMRQWGAFYRPGCLISWGSSEIWSPACPACGFCAMKPTQGWNRTRPRTGLLLTIRVAPTSGERCPVDRGRWSWRGSKANFMHVFSISAWKVLVFTVQPNPS